MHIGIQLEALDGFENLRKGVIYHFLYSDWQRERVLLVSFHPPPSKKAKTSALSSKGSDDVQTDTVLAPGSIRGFQSILTFISRYRFEQGMGDRSITICSPQQELPPWFQETTIADLTRYEEIFSKRKKSHLDRIDRQLTHILSLSKNVRTVLSAADPDSLINTHARHCKPIQNQKRFRTAFYAYVCFGNCRWVLHYAVQRIGRWDRMNFQKKFGRPSQRKGGKHGYGTNDADMIEKIVNSYKKYRGTGVPLNKIYRRAMASEFHCDVQPDEHGNKRFIHPTGEPFPSFDQFRYRVLKAFPLLERQIDKYGAHRVRDKIAHSKGRYTESVGYLMEKTEQDAYCCDEVTQGNLPGTQLPALYVVVLRCTASGMKVGIGFSIGSELAQAYRMALFCAAIDKVHFCKLFGYEIEPKQWPSIGLPVQQTNDRGPGSTRKALPSTDAYRPMIMEIAPSYSGQSKANIEASHPKSTKTQGGKTYAQTNKSIPQLAVQEIVRAIMFNDTCDISARLNNDALAEGCLPTPNALWRYLDDRGRTMAMLISFEEAVRTFLTPIELTVRDDAVYYKGVRFNAPALKNSDLLQKAHRHGRYQIRGFMLDVCIRYLWIDLGNRLQEVAADLAVRDGENQLYISLSGLLHLDQIRHENSKNLAEHREASRVEHEMSFEKQTGRVFDQSTIRKGRNRRHKADSVSEAKEVKRIMQAGGRR